MNYSGSVDLLKARSSAKDSDGPGSSSRKRKESPSSVAFLDASPPAIDPSKTGAGGIRQLPLKLQLAPQMQMQHQQQQQLQLQQRQQAVHLSPDLVGPTKTSNRLAAAGAAAAQRNHHTALATPLTGVSHVIDRSVGSHNKPINSNEDMQQPGAKRGKVAPTLAHTHSTPVTATLTASARAGSTSSTGRQLRSRKGHDEIPPAPSSVGSAKMQLQYAAPHGNNYSSQQQQPQMLPLKAGKHLPTPMYAQQAAHPAHSAHAPSSSSAGKKRQVQFAPFAPVVYEYPFFGPDNPKTSKAIALKCLDYLEGKDIYAMSQVNSFWCKAAMDDALWE
eukprot:gene29219-33001_t